MTAAVRRIRRAASAASVGARRSRTASPAIERGVALGFLAMTPLLALYELALAGGVARRNTAEFVATAPLRALGAGETALRWAILAACAALAVRALFDARLGLVARVGRTIGEGLAAALVLGPIAIVVARAALGAERFEALSTPHASLASPSLAAFVVGGAAWEEIVFRVGLQSALFVVVRETLAFFVGVPALVRIGSEAASIVLCAGLFAAAHLSGLVATVSSGGEPFDAGVFAWRFLAGALLGVLFRWRGPGVAAWAHAFSNLALFVGAGPEVFL